MAWPTRDDLNYHRAIRRKRNRGRSTFSLVGLRVRDLERLFGARYGVELPDDDSGRDDALVMAHHLAGYATGDPAEHIHGWLRRMAPWMSSAERAAIVERVTGKPLRYRADTLARRVGLGHRERAALQITTIGAVDKPKKERERERRERKRQAREAARRAAGAVTRAEYRAMCRAASAAAKAKRPRPWEAAGMSRATWYRHGKPEAAALRETPVRAQHISFSADTNRRLTWRVRCAHTDGAAECRPC
jgi:hypothetical protein